MPTFHANVKALVDALKHAENHFLRLSEVCMYLGWSESKARSIIRALADTRDDFFRVKGGIKWFPPEPPQAPKTEARASAEQTANSR